MTDLVAELAELTGLAQPLLVQAGLVFLRVGGMVALMPALGEALLPTRIKLAATLALTLVTAPALQLPVREFALASVLIEPVVGLSLGLGLRMMILALQTAGTLVAQSVSLSQMFNGSGPEPQPIVASLLLLAGTALFVNMGGLSQAARLLITSYDLLPVGQLPRSEDLARWGVARGAAVLAEAFALASPFVLAALIYNLALGVINRAMPALMVVMIGAPALTLGGLMLLMLIAPVLLEAWQDGLHSLLARPLGP